MRVMLVEDEPHKIADLESRLRAMNGPDPEVVVVRSVRDAVLYVHQSRFDLIVLDMALPTFSGKGATGGVQQAVGGIEVLRALQELGLSSRVIVVTQYPDMIINGEVIPLHDIARYVKRRYGQAVIGAVLYSYKASEWEEEFKRALEAIT